MIKDQYDNIGIVFGDKPWIKVIVEPLLNEHTTASCDIGGRIKESYQLYGKRYDFSKMTSYMIEKQNWFMDLFYDNEVKKMIESKVE